MDLRIKEATLNDIPVIHKLATEIWRQHYPDIISGEQIEYMLDMMYSEKSLREQMQKGHKFFIAVDETPAGYLSYSHPSDNNYFLHKFYIETDKQRKGSGKQMLNYLLNRIPDGSFLRLTVNRKNHKAINFYFKNGFTIEEVKDFDIGNGFLMEDFVMVKQIRS
jgi:GNAT superfamily N-acetyltransferase